MITVNITKFWCAIKLQTTMATYSLITQLLSLLRMTTDNCTLPINSIVTTLLQHQQEL